MNGLLDSAVTAHGGLDRWNQVKSITVDASITGAVWYAKNQGDALKNIRFEVDTTRQLLAIDFVGQDKRSVFEPHRVLLGLASASSFGRLRPARGDLARRSYWHTGPGSRGPRSRGPRSRGPRSRGPRS